MAAEKLEVLLEVDSTTGIAEIKRTGKALDEIGTTSETTGRRTGRAFDSIGGSVFKINQILDFSQRAFRALSAPMEKIIAVGAKFETIELQLSTILQSAEKGKEYFEWIRDFSATTPFRIEGLAESVAMLESFGINSKTHLRTFGDAASALQIPLNELSRVMGQIWSKPTAQMEEMLQLIERGVPVAKILQEQLGITADQFANIGRQGIKGKEVFDALAKGMKELYGGAMEKFSGTWTGMISTLQDKVDLFLGQIAGPVMENLKGKLESLLERINQWAKDGTLEKVAKEIAGFISDAVETIAKIGEFLWKYRDEIILFAKIFATLWAVDKINKFGQSIIGLVGNVTNGIKTLKGGIGGLSGALGKLGLIAGAAFVGWKIGERLREFFDMTAEVAKITKLEMELEYAISARKAGLTEAALANSEYNRQIREIGQSLGENSNSILRNSTAILNNKEAYEKLTPELQALVLQYAKGHEKALEYTKVQKEQALAIEEAKKKEEALRIAKEEARKAQELQTKKIQEFADKLKLTNNYQAEIEEKTRLLTAAVKLAGPEWDKNSQAVEEVAKYIKELREQYKGADIEIPAALQKIETALKLTKAEEEAWNQIGKESGKTFKDVAGALDTGVKATLDFQGSTDLAKQSLEAAQEMTQTWSYKIDVLCGSIQSFAKIVLNATDALSYMGLISEKTSNSLNLLGGGLGEIGSGIENLIFNSESIFDYFTNGLSVVTGVFSVVSGIIGLLSGKSGEMEAAERRLAGITGLSGDWAEQIEKIAQELGGADSAGRAFNLVLSQIIQNADRTVANFSILIRKTREIVSTFEQGNATARETAANYGAAFSEMINFARELGMEGGEAITGLILLADEFGLKVKEIEEYVQTNMKNAFEGYKKYIQGEFSSVTIGVFEEMRILQDKIANNQKLVDGVRGLSDTMIGLSNATRLTEEQYQNFETAAYDAYNSLINQGFTTNEALQIMQPMLERLAFLQQQFGYSVDDSTMALINQGVEAGLISENMKTENQLMIDGFDRIVDRLDLIAIGLGVKIPDALGSMENASARSFNNISYHTEKWGNQLNSIQGQWRSLSNEILTGGLSVNTVIKQEITNPNIRAAEGFQTLLDRPTSIFLQGKHILAGEAGPEIFSITPLQGIPMPVSRKSGTDLPPIPYTTKTGSDSKPEKKEITVTVKLEGKIEGAYPPVIIQTKQDGSVNKEKLRASIGEIVDDNHRGFVDRIAAKVVEKIKEEL